MLGQAARDLVLQADALPGAGQSARVSHRIERLGGKGANIAIGLHQLNPEAAPAIVAVLGTDAAGDAALGEAAESGLDVTHVARRGRTALLTDVVTGFGERRLLEDIPAESLLQAGDVVAAADVLRQADIVVLQLQQPSDVLLEAGRLAHGAGARVVLDGAVEGDARDELLALASVVRADAHEAALLSGTRVDSRDEAARAAERIRALGPTLVALAVPGKGDLLVWGGGEIFYPHRQGGVVDPTGAGDAFVAGLVTGMSRGYAPPRIGQLAADAASATVQHIGGHPDLSGSRFAH